LKKGDRGQRHYFPILDNADKYRLVITEELVKLMLSARGGKIQQGG
jgi:hypothetical protein